MVKIYVINMDNSDVVEIIDCSKAEYEKVKTYLEKTYDESVYTWQETWKQ